MSSSLEERIAKSKAHTAQLERLWRAKIKREREMQKKKEQLRNYIVGELVTKYFPELKDLQPGTKAENTITFEPLENFLSTLSADKQLVQQIKEKAACNVSMDDEKCHDLHSDCPEHVSGHQQNPRKAYARKGGVDHG